MKITAAMVAAELRMFADRLDSNPDVEIVQPFMMFHHYSHTKAEFFALAKLMPRPIKKSVSSYTTAPDLQLDYESPALRIMNSIPQSATCTLITPAQPAVYDCDPILSAEEDASLVEEEV